MPVVYSHQVLSGDARAARPLLGGIEDQKWVGIQLKTFTRWVNEQLAKRGSQIEDLRGGFTDGVQLITLVEILQQRKCTGRIYRNSPNEIQMLANVQLALDAMMDDGVKLVNIGTHDIVEGNLKLILGIVWCLIQRYQIGGKTKIPPRKLMLAWLRAVLPEFNITNFSQDWNDGVALSALLEYCRPGLFPDWRSMNRNRSLETCKKAMETAKETFGIPMILAPEDLSSPNLDELSGMTYLSYFMKEGSPGYFATLHRLKSLMPSFPVRNFSTDWNDGFAICHIVRDLGANLPGFNHLTRDPTFWTRNVQMGLHGVKTLGIEPTVTAQEMVENESESLAVMALAAKLCNVTPVASVKRTAVTVKFDSSRSYTTMQQVNVEILSGDQNLSTSDFEVDISSPSGLDVPCHLRRTQLGALLSFVVTEEGVYKVRLYHLGEEITGPNPIAVKTVNPTPTVISSSRMPLKQFESDSPPKREVNKVSFSGLSEPCAVGSIVEVVINAHGASEGQVLVEAFSPTGKIFQCPVHQKGTTYTATFNPNEVGEWKIAIYYDQEHIKGSPFLCFCYDANLVQVYGLDVGVVGQELQFNVNTNAAGSGDLKVNVLHHGQSIPVNIEKQGGGLHKVQFTPDGAGQYKIHIYFNNMEVKGSPFILDIVDASSVSVYGENLRMASVGKLSTFMIHAVGADSKDLTVTIQAPSGKKKRARVIPVGDSAYRAEWKPIEAGEHQIDVRLYSQSVQDSPFTCNVGDPELVTVRNMPVHIQHTDLGEPHSFEIDASAAGSGNLEIMINAGRVPCRVKDLGGRCYLASFIPNQPITHVVEMRFNGDPVKGSPWRVEVSIPTGADSTLQSSTSSVLTSSMSGGGNYVLQPINLANLSSSGQLAYLPPNFFAPQPPTGDILTTTTSTFSQNEEVSREFTTVSVPIELTGPGLKQASVGRIANFEIGAKGITADQMEVKIVSPAGKNVPCNVVSSRSGTFKCEYIPSEVGTYLVHINIDGKPIEDSPLAVSAYSAHKVFIEPIPGGAVGQPVQFYVDANDAGRGELEISVNEGKVPNNVQMQGAGRCLVTFIPEQPGNFVIDVTFNGELIRGCPVSVEVGDIPQSFQPPLIPLEKQMITTTTTTTRQQQFGVDRGESPLSQSTFQSSITPSPPNEAKLMSTFQPPKSSFEQSTFQPPKSAYETTYDSSKYSSSTFEPPKPSAYDSSVRSAAINTELGRTVYTPHSYEGGKVVSSTTSYSYSSKTAGGKVSPFDYPPPPPPELTIPTAPPPPPPQINFESKRKFVEPSRDELEFSRKPFVAPSEPQVDFGRKPFVAPSEPQVDFSRKPFLEPAETQVEFGQKAFVEPSRDEVDFSRKSTGITAARYGTDQADQKRFATDNYTAESRVSRAVREFERSRFETKEPEVVRKIESRSIDETVVSTPETYKPADEILVEKETIRTPPANADISRLSYDSQRGFIPPPPPVYSMTEYSTSPTKETSEAPKERYFGQETPVKSIPFQPPQESFVFSTDSHKVTTSTRAQKQPEPQVIGYTSVTRLSRDSDGLAPKEAIPVAFDPQRSTRLEEQKALGLMDAALASETANKSFSQEDFSDEFHMESPQSKRIRQQFVPPAEHLVAGTLQRDNDGLAPIPIAQMRVTQAEKQRESETFPAPPTFDVRNIRILGPEKWVIRVDQPCQFEVKPLKPHDLKMLTVSVMDTITRNEVPVLIIPKGDGIQVEFVPHSVGTHKIFADVGSTPLSGTPISVKVFNPDKISVETVEGGLVRQPVKFTVDASDAGFGSLEIAVRDSDRTIVPSKVNQPNQQTARFIVSFTPTKVGQYEIHVSFNGENLKGSPFPCPISEAKLESGLIASKDRPPKHITVGKPVVFNVKSVPSEKDLSITATGPEKKNIPVTITDTGSATYQVEFTPETVGDHQIEVKIAEMQSNGSPFTCRVYDAKKIRVGDISTGTLGQPVHFVVDASEAGVGNLEVAVNEGRIPSMAQSLGQHRYDISFVPKDDIPHTISVKFNNESVPGSPFTCTIASQSRPPLNMQKLSASGPGLERIPAARAAKITVDHQGEITGDDVLTALIKDPTGAEVKSVVNQEKDGNFSIEYVPQVIGNHNISVMVNDNHLLGSPYTAKVYDATKVVLSPVEGGGIGKPAMFQIDASKAGAGNMEIIVSVEGKNVPNFVQAEGGAKFRVSFTPQESKIHSVSVKFNGEPVPGSPMDYHLTNLIKCVAVGEGLKTAGVNKTAFFTVETKDAGEADCNVDITAPSGRKLPVTISKESDSDVTRVDFVAQEVGDHQIEIFYGTSPIQSGKFSCSVWDSRLVKVTGIKSAVIGKAAEFQIDASEAGKGDPKVDVVVEKSNSIVKCELEPSAMGNSLYTCMFVPREKANHSVYIYYNNDEVEGSPFICNVVEAAELRVIGEALKLAQCGQVAEFTIEGGNDATEKELNVEIAGPDKELLACSVFKTGDTTFSVEFLPATVGKHKINITTDGNHIEGSPYNCYVFDYAAVKIEGPKEGMLGKEIKYKIDHSKAGRGYFDVDVTLGDKPLRTLLESQQVDKMSVISFTPSSTGIHSLNIQFNGHPVIGSPFNVAVSDARQIQAVGEGLKMAQVKAKCHFTVLLNSIGTGELDVVITAPNDGPVPVKCFQQKDGNFRVEYTPTMIGPHKIFVTFSEAPIDGSPFIAEAVDPRKVVIDEIRDCLVNTVAAIKINRKEAGKGELKATLSDPKGQPLPFEMVSLSSGHEEMRFTPTRVGKYQLQVSFAGYEVPNTPVVFTADEPGKPTAHGEGLQRAITQELATFTVDAKKVKGDIKVEVIGPSGKIKPNVEKLESHWKVTYKPTEGGPHDIKILWNNKELPGSPFHLIVSDPSKVKLLLNDLDSKGRIQLKVGQETTIVADVSEAGPGTLRSEVRGPTGKIPVRIEDGQRPAEYKLSFIPAVEGDHFLYLYWSDCPVEGTPAPGYAEPGEVRSDPSNVTVRGDGLREAQLQSEAEFIVDGTNAGSGRPRCAIVGSKADIPVTLTPLGQGVWRATYTPVIAGKYALEVFWNDVPVKGSPFKLLVEAEGDASRVVVTGENLKNGIIGQDIKANVDVRRAGGGTLTATCTGPATNAVCQLLDGKDGTYTLTVKPQEVGKHSLAVKYNNTNVPGSPFSLYISSPPDPSKVRVYGSGVEHGILSKFNSNFVVDTKGAGAGQLTVRVRGPKGAFNVEMQRGSKHDRTIHCKYDPREPGDYQIEVKWAGEDVPESPFTVMIFDTQAELDRFASGQPVNPQPHHLPFLPPGWVGPPPPGMMPPGPMGPMQMPPGSYGPPPPRHPLPPMAFPPQHRMALPYANSTIYSTGSHRDYRDY